MVHQMRGALGHPAPATTGAHCPSLAGKGDETIQATSLAAKTCEAARKESTAQEALELLLDEPRQALAVADMPGLRAKGLEVIAHDQVQRAVVGRPRLVPSRSDHAAKWGERRATSQSHESGQIGAALPSRVAISASEGPDDDRRIRTLASRSEGVPESRRCCRRGACAAATCRRRPGRSVEKPGSTRSNCTEAGDEQSDDDEQRHRQRDLHGEQRGADAQSAAIGRAVSAAAQRSVGRQFARRAYSYPPRRSKSGLLAPEIKPITNKALGWWAITDHARQGARQSARDSGWMGWSGWEGAAAKCSWVCGGPSHYRFGLLIGD